MGLLHKSSTFTNCGIILEWKSRLYALRREFISKAEISVRVHRTVTRCCVTQQMPLYPGHTVAFSELK